MGAVACPDMVAPVANMVAAALQGGVSDDYCEQDHHRPPAAVGRGLHPSVHDGPGAREHRVDYPAIRAGGRGCAPGMGLIEHRGDRLRPRDLRPQRAWRLAAATRGRAALLPTSFL